MIKVGVKTYRNIKYNTNDYSINYLTEGLKSLANLELKGGIKYMSNEDHNIFALPRTPINQAIYFDDNKSGFTLSDVISKSKDLVKTDIEMSYEQIIGILRNIYRHKYTENEKTLTMLASEEINCESNIIEGSNSHTIENNNKDKKIKR